jgi:hypothetical protein
MSSLCFDTASLTNGRNNTNNNNNNDGIDAINIQTKLALALICEAISIISPAIAIMNDNHGHDMSGIEKVEKGVGKNLHILTQRMDFTCVQLLLPALAFLPKNNLMFTNNTSSSLRYNHIKSIASNTISTHINEPIIITLLHIVFQDFVTTCGIISQNTSSSSSMITADDNDVDVNPDIINEDSRTSISFKKLECYCEIIATILCKVSRHTPYTYMYIDYYLSNKQLCLFLFLNNSSNYVFCISFRFQAVFYLTSY